MGFSFVRLALIFRRWQRKKYIGKNVGGSVNPLYGDFNKLHRIFASHSKWKVEVYQHWYNSTFCNQNLAELPDFEGYRLSPKGDLLQEMLHTV